MGNAGKRCLFHARICKSSPRGSSGAELEAQQRLHLMARLGLSFEDVSRSVHSNDLPAADTLAELNTALASLLPTGGVGMAGTL